MTNNIQANPISGPSPISNNRTWLRTILVLALLLMGVNGVKAADYVITYTTGGTTYYLARNGTTGVQRVNTFDPTTCIWSCSSNTAGTTASTLGTSNRYLFQMVNGTRYFLNYNLGLGTTAGNNNRVRTNNNIIYFYNSYRYIILSDNTPTYSTTTTTGRARADQITSNTVTSVSTNPTINGADILTATGNSTYTATGAAYRIGYTEYSFNGVSVYLDANGYIITPANATIGSYTWTLTDNAYATVNNSGYVNVSNLPASDVTLTLTASAEVTGGTPTAPSGTTLTGTKEITIQGTTPSAPIIEVSGTTVTLSTEAAGTTTIRYTLDGTAPTATTGTVYSGAIDLSSSTTSPITIKAITVRNGNASDVTTQVVTLTLPEPVITVDVSAGTATITATSGATIYYTTDGTDPTTSSSQYSGSLSGLAAMTTIKAIAVKTGWNDSPVVSETVTIPSGADGGTVTLFDYEDHNWSYYQPNGGIDASYGYPSELCSPYPRNVKITYEGNGKMFTGDDNSSLTDATGVQVGLTSEGETEHTFVYYKTLERDANNRFPYEMIPNPFQVRPTYANDATTKWRGFYKWRITSLSGGDIYDASSGGIKVADGSTNFTNSNIYLDANKTYYFQPYDNSATNANNVTSMEIAVEAVWARADVSTTSVPTTYNSVERNFYVGTSNVFTGTAPGTCSSFYPHGATTANGAPASATMANRSQIQAGTAGADKKVEYYIITGGTVNTGGYKLDIGRGVTNSGNTGITPLSGTHNDSDKNARLRIESGTYGGSTINLYGTPTTNKLVHLDLILGSDYDRANGDNDKLSIAKNNQIAHGGHTATNNTGWLSFQHLDIMVKSGKMQSGYFSNSSAGYDRTFYCRSTLSTAGQYPGISYLTIEGGEFASVNGGRGNYQDNVALDDDIVFSLRMKGGTIHGSIYGAASANPSHGGRRVVMTGGTVEGWIAGGCDGTSSGGGSTIGDAYFYIGGNAIVGSPTRDAIDGTDAGNIFGAGRGMSNHGTSAQPASMRNAFIAVADNGFVLRNVYGGGDYGYTGVTQSNGTISDQTAANFFILGGTVQGAVHGGGNNNNSACSNANINMTGGLVKGGIYGGSNNSGTIAYNVTMKIDGGQVGTTSQTANIHGGGYGSPTRVSGNVDITLGTTTQTTPGVTVYGDVYGGSALGYVNGTTAADTYHTYVTLNNGIINGSIYGGGLGDGSTEANVYGPVQVKVYGGSVKKTDSNGANGSGGVYGANNVNGAPQRSVTVDIYGTDPAPSANEYALFAVYGGGNAADYGGTPLVTVHNCDNSIEYVYGGGNAAAVAATNVTIYGGNKIGNVFAGGNGTVTAANVTGNTNVNIYGGTIGKVFGGSNSKGSIGGTINVNVAKQAGDTDPDGSSTACAMHIDEVYGGGNMAASNAGNITIGCTGNEGEGIGDLYGGANQANITGDISLNITGGSIDRVFGGNNYSGTINGDIQVDVNWKTTDPCGYNYLGSVFGGGNQATYTGDPVVNIINGTVSGNVYGGGAGTLVDGADRGKAGKVTGNPQVTIGDDISGHTVTILGDVYGGGDAADVDGTPVVVVYDHSTDNSTHVCSTTINNLYGGGNAADVKGTDITVYGGTITQDAFGGGHGDKDASNPSKYADVDGDVSFLINGGKFGRVFAGSNSKGDIKGTSSLTIEKDGNCPLIIREVYGGGNEAAGNAGELTINCTGTLVTGTAGHVAHPENIGTSLEGIGAVYGGANQANIGEDGDPSNITLNINSGMVANVYGGNNADGVIYGTIQVNINKTPGACGWYVGNVFGGGNEADYSGTPDVNIMAGTVSGSVFGGGNAADVGGSDVSVSGGQVNGSVYGGCNSSGDAGAVAISLTGGQIGTSGTRADVYGGGYGASTTTSGDIDVILNGTTVYGDLYGGSAFGSVNDASADPANTTTLTISSNSLYGTIYGGGKGDVTGQEGHSNVTATSNGNVIINYNTTNTNLTGIYGGANINGQVVGNIVVNVKGDVGTDADPINVFGGGLGAPTSTNGSVTVNVGVADVASAPTIYGDVYGGSALGTVNDDTGDLTTINILNGTVHGNIYGGGLGDATVNANGYLDTTQPTVEAIVNGTVHVNIGHETNTNSAPTIDGKVFGCNNLAGTPKGNVYVDVYRTDHTTANSYPDPAPTTIASMTNQAAYAILEVYGGGNLAHYTTTLEGASTHVHIHNCDNTIQYVYGGGNAANTPATSVIIDGGRFNYVFGGGNGAGTGNPGANVAGNSNVTLNGGIIDYVFGGSNTLGVVNGVASINFDDPARTCTRLIKELYGGGNMAPGGSVDLTIPCGVTGLNLVYGGSRNADIGTEALFNGGTKKNVTLTIEGGTLAQVFGGNNQGGIIWGDVTLNLEGGTIVDAYGGNNAGGNVKGSITVNVIDAESSTCPLTLTNVFGGGKDAAYTPADATISSPEVNIKHVKNGNSISGSVFGGGQGATADVTSNPIVTIGDDESNHYVTIAGNVYGGGDAAAVDGSTTVEMKNAHSTAANLFGGGNQAGVSGTASVTLTAGHVTTGIYGGCNTSGTVSGAIDVNINGGKTGTDATNLANVHGGGYGSATATGNDVTVTIGNGTSTPEIWGDVYGGSGFGNVNDASAEPAQTTKVWLRSGTINGSLYGGGLGQLGDDTTDPETPDYPAYVNGNVIVLVDGGAVKKTTNTTVTTGAVFGCNNVNGTPKGTVTVTINSTEASTGSGNNKVYALQGVYGGGNLAHYNPTTTGNYPTVTINGCNTSIKDVYGGGNAAAVPYTSVTVWGGDIDRVFAGGNGESGTAHVGYMNTDAAPSGEGYGAGTASATIYGGTINQVFGGSNANGVIRVSSSISIDKDDSEGACEMHIGEVYGGGNEADGNAGTITIGCTGDYEHNQEGIGDVYGGANKADVSNSIELNITGGHINRVFGGNNTSGAISGTITVNVDWNGSCTDNYLGYVFGGGNQAPYGDSEHNKGNYPVVNIKKADIANNVFGGGLGATAIVYGNPQVTIGNLTTSKTVDITGDVYGGGDAAAVVGTPVVHVINNCDNAIGNVYGGGNAADVNGTNVTIDGGHIGMVFGGGHGDKDADPQKEANVDGDVNLTVTGGTISKVFGGSNSKGNITGDITLSVDKGDNSCEMHITELYGGGNEAAGNAGSITIGCTGDYENNQEGIGDVYGGANAAAVNNSIELNITGGHINRVFGGNNTSGSIGGTIQVNVNWNDNSTCGDNYIGSVYGGGNKAPYSNSGNYPEVNIINGTITNNVFGGGLGVNAIVTANPYVNITGGSIGGNVFGGGDAAAVTGSTKVDINASTAAITGKVFGGGNEAGVSSNAVVTLAAGSVGAGVYGGCNTEGTIGGYTQVNVTGGTVGASTADAHTNNVHGGGYGQNTKVSGNVTVNIGTQNAATGPTIYGDIYGGSAMGTVNTPYNASTHTTYETTTVNLYSGTIDGNVYGGGLGTSSIPAYVYGNAQVYQDGAILISRTQDDPEIAGLKIPVSGMIFGCNNVNGTPKGHVKVVVTKTTGTTGQQMSSTTDRASTEESDHTYHMLAVFGGGNEAAYEPDSRNESTEVIINGCNVVSIHSVYGGGNAASTPATNVTISGAYEIEYVFGGGNGAGTNNPGANVGYKAYPESVAGPNQVSARENYAYGTGVAATNIYGGRIHKVFGGSNTKGNVRSSSMAMLDEVSECPLILDGFYGGGKSAYMEGKGNIHLGCVSGLAEIYGGAERANVGSDIVLTLTSGHYNKVYGGNNLSGMVMGSITINIEQTGCLPITIDELFGGGNNAAYSVYGYNDDESIKTSGTQIHHDPVINIRSCQSIGAIYGGGEGINATLAGNPHINVNIVKGWVDGQHTTYNTPQDLENDGVIGTIFGGGKKAKVIGDTYIFIADQEKVEMQSLKDLKTIINSATGSESTTIEFGVTGSGENEAITYTKSGESSPTLTKTITQTVNGATITGNVYGGGSEADITGSSHIKVGPDGQPQQQGGTQGGAPIRSEQPADQPQQPAQPQDPANGGTNGATESLRNNDANLRRL